MDATGAAAGFMMETFLRTQSVALTEQGHASEGTLLLNPADADAASIVTIAWRECGGRFEAATVADPNGPFAL